MKRVTRTAMMFMFVAAILTACGGGDESKDKESEEPTNVEAAVDKAKKEAGEAAKATEEAVEAVAKEAEAEAKEAVEEVKAEKRGAKEGETNEATKRGGESTDSEEPENKATKR